VILRRVTVITRGKPSVSDRKYSDAGNLMPDRAPHPHVPLD
jgi:hypothetical protein